MNTGKMIAFDFDAVIAKYHGFVSVEHTGEPIQETVEAMRELRKRGYRLLIHSTRGDDLLRAYCEKHDIPYDYINRRPDKEGENAGKPVAFAYVDDRAVCYKGQSATELVNEIESFKAYWQD